ncbi:MAG: hypothetical protein QNJ75_13295 [Acidimicrobiia bacterium]|nr:hypothetical protein [Acidimicrobiia bacterium]
MMRKSVGYFEGTDARLLTALVLSGYDTIPVSNGVDHHGMCVGRVNRQTKTDILIGYPHKITARPDDEIQLQDVFHICKTYDIPLLLEVPEHLQERTKDVLGETPRVVELLDPADTLSRALQLLG